MGAHHQPNLEAFDADREAQALAALRRTELVEELRAHIGQAVCVTGYPVKTTVSTETTDENGKPRLVSAPVYSLLDAHEDRKPRELENVALLDVICDAKLGHMVMVSAVSPDEVLTRRMEPGTLQSYKFTLNRITEFRFAEVLAETSS